MGCVNSHVQHTSKLSYIPTNCSQNSLLGSAIFPVTALTSNGLNTSKHNAGSLHITETEIVLHRKGHSPVRWPLMYLRRYGFEEGIFSFESGRRCASGPGLFTFRCSRAESLFHLVQTNVQNHAQLVNGDTPLPFIHSASLPSPTRRSNTMGHVDAPDTNPYLRPNSALGLRPPRPLSLDAGISGLTRSSQAINHSDHEIVQIGGNHSLNTRRRRLVSVPPSKSSSNQRPRSPRLSDSNPPMDDAPDNEVFLTANEDTTLYINVNVDDDASPFRHPSLDMSKCIKSERPLNKYSIKTPLYSNKSDNDKLEYVSLEVGSPFPPSTPLPSSPLFNTPNHVTNGGSNACSNYAKIDYNKTSALKETRDERTRHESDRIMAAFS